jgi:hypothetical protein
MQNKKTLGVTATAIYSAFSGLIILPIGLLLMFAGEAARGNTLFMLGGIFACFLGIFLLASVYGLWTLQEWGRQLTIWLFGFSILLGLISIFPLWPGQQFTIANTVLQLLGILICVLIIRYLTKERIRDIFN